MATKTVFYRISPKSIPFRFKATQTFHSFLGLRLHALEQFEFHSILYVGISFIRNYIDVHTIYFFFTRLDPRKLKLNKLPCISQKCSSETFFSNIAGHHDALNTDAGSHRQTCWIRRWKPCSGSQRGALTLPYTHFEGRVLARNMILWLIGVQKDFWFKQLWKWSENAFSFPLKNSEGVIKEILCFYSLILLFFRISILGACSDSAAWVSVQPIAAPAMCFLCTLAAVDAPLYRHFPFSLVPHNHGGRRTLFLEHRRISKTVGRYIF